MLLENLNFFAIFSSLLCSFHWVLTVQRPASTLSFLSLRIHFILGVASSTDST